jgi:CIC family chloride channel protein
LKIGLKGTDKSLPSGFLEAVVAGAGKLPFRESIARTFSSLVSISSGCSIGREGSIVNFSASIASKLGQLLNFQPYKLRFLTACGAAAGLSAAFNAPLSGAVFAAHIVIGNFSMSLFAPIILASVFAAMTSRSFFGIEPLYTVPIFEFTRIGQLPWLVLVGIGSGFIGAIFMKGMELSEKYFKKTIKTDLLRMALADCWLALLPFIIRRFGVMVTVLQMLYSGKDSLFSCYWGYLPQRFLPQ